MEETFNIKEIMDSIMHRYPFLLIDRVIEFEDSKRIVCIKNVSINEPYFPGHFPGMPVMPGALILEALAQAAAMLAMKSTKGIAEGKAVLLVGADNIKWRKIVTPGDTLTLEVNFIKNKSVFWYFDVIAKVGDEVACKGTLSAAESER